MEFNVPFQHKYGYIRDEVVTGKVVTNNVVLCHYGTIVVNTMMSSLLCDCPGAGTGVPFHFHGPGFAEVIYGRKVL